MSNLISAFDSGVYILFMVLAIIFGAGLLALVVYSVRRERVRFMETVPEKGMISIDNMKHFVDKTLAVANKKTTLTLFQVDIRDYDNLLKAVGETQYSNIVVEVTNMLSRLLPWGIKLAMKKPDTVIMSVRYSVGFEPEKMAELILQNLSKKMTLSGDLQIDVNINVAIASYPDAGRDYDEMNKNLELAMVVSRRKGVNNFAVYTSQIGNAETEEFRFYQEIRDAMKDKEFMLYYQPIIDSNTLEICSAESLIRWKHKTKGILSPAVFLNIMEKTGDINWVGNWCFEQLVKQLQLWRSNYEQKFGLTLNLSERQLLNPNLADELRDIVRKSKGNPQNFGMEISGGTLYNTSEVVKQNMNKLAQFGFQISVDFGSECTDLGMLEKFVINIIKLEGDFWKKTKESSVAENIVAMLVRYARENNIILIAQGVENREEFKYLRSIGINYMQGYLFSAPKDAKEFIGDVVMTPWQADLRTSNGRPISFEEDKISTRTKSDENLIINENAVANGLTEKAPNEKKKLNDEANSLMEGNPSDDGEKK